MRSVLLMAAVILYNNCLAQKLDLSKSEDLITAFVKVRGSLDPKEETVVYDQGIIYAVIPNQPIKAILKFEMYNIARFEKIEQLI